MVSGIAPIFSRAVPDTVAIPDTFGAIPDTFGAVPDTSGAIPDTFLRKSKVSGTSPVKIGAIPDTFRRKSKVSEKAPMKIGVIPDTLLALYRTLLEGGLGLLIPQKYPLPNLE